MSRSVLHYQLQRKEDGLLRRLVELAGDQRPATSFPAKQDLLSRPVADGWIGEPLCIAPVAASSCPRAWGCWTSPVIVRQSSSGPHAAEPMYRTWMRNAPSHHAGERFQTFLAALLKSSLRATTCSALMREWLYEVDRLRRSRLSLTEQTWVSSELVNVYTHLKRSDGVIEAARGWEPGELSEGFCYRKYAISVDLDPEGGPRAWAVRLKIAALAGARYRCFLETPIASGHRQRLPGNVYMSSIEQARRIIDDLWEGQLRVRLAAEERPASVYRGTKRQVPSLVST